MQNVYQQRMLSPYLEMCRETSQFCTQESLRALVLVQMQAEINLMREGLKEPLNERFVLLSETCIPLYPATLVWAQLLSEPKSRIHACTNASNPDDEGRRMTYRSDLIISKPQNSLLAAGRSPAKLLPNFTEYISFELLLWLPCTAVISDGDLFPALNPPQP